MSSFFFFNDTATTEIYTLSLHDALPIFARGDRHLCAAARVERVPVRLPPALARANHHARGGARPLHLGRRSEEHTSELQSQSNLVCRLLLEKKKVLDV